MPRTPVTPMLAHANTLAAGQSRVREALADALAGGLGLDTPPEPPWDAFVAQFAGALRDGLRSLGPRAAIAAAVTAARGQAPLATAEAHEAWARACAVCAAREIVRAAAGIPEPMLRASVVDHAVALVAACDQTFAFPLELPTPPTLVGRMIAAGRSSSAVARARAGASRNADGYVTAVGEELDAQLPRVLDREGAARGAVRYALARADESQRRRGIAAPAETAQRAALARAALIECAAGMVSAVPRDERLAPQAAWAHLWLARRACRIALGAGEGALECAHPPDAASTENPSQTAEDPVKESQSTLLRTLETDATDAAWRTAGTQFVKLAREPLVVLLSRHLAPDDESFRARVAAFLDTEIGAALLASMLSLGLGALPNGAGEVPQRLARELRVRAISEAGNVVADVLMEPLREVMTTYLRDASAVIPRRVDPAVLAEGEAVAFAAAQAATAGGERSAG